jgi:ribonuclease BN (tRNA processing enzyme)
VRPFLSTGESEPIDGTFEVHDLHDGERVELGPLRLEAVATVHSVETYAVRASAGGRILGYSADSGPCDALGRVADQADLFICEAAWSEWPEGTPPIHLTPELAGEWAAKARARRLLLTHLRPGSDPAAAAARAAEAYGGPVEMATELEVHEL